MPELSPLQLNARDLEQELAWFSRLLDARFKSYFNPQESAAEESDLTPPDLSASQSPYADFLRHYQLSFAERVAVVLGLAPHIRPRLLDVFFLKNNQFDRKFTEFGGLFGGPDGDFTPTGETLIFLLAGEDLAVRFSLQSLFDGEHFFAQHNILRLTPSADEAALKAPLRLSEE